ncbi:protein of unknown function (DUF4394) [Frankia torreyi]|uniref:DUF4394 domain-containing protein n=1 Tax=Frankia torreyi TaxID=1856 RepID=A0A0D8BDM1_9ACTN|nr:MULTISPECIES: DUF4394 domain-containing protein [Frankia]KJE22271.1 protein of unknown function (DUF4394) [Frankia torreyi]KQC37923.1 hypothetical protein UK82_13120 [Frankia sp. ACN1ag]
MSRSHSSARAAALTAALAAGIVAAIPGLAGVASAAPAAPGAAGAAAVSQRPALFGGLRAVGLTTTGYLVRFDVNAPSRLVRIGRVTGLVGGDTSLIGIDYRVQNSRLYGVGNLGGIYVINTSNAVAIRVSHLTVALSGTAFDVDFDPAANRLHIISNTGQNLRHNLDDSIGTPPIGTTVVDTPLKYPPAVIAANGLTGAAYTNNDLDPATSTTLFTINTTLGQVDVDSPANSGQLVPTGRFGVPVGGNAGFDIYTRRSNGRAVSNRAFATLLVGTTYRLAEIDPLTGRIRAHGSFPSNAQVADIAIPPNQ